MIFWKIIIEHKEQILALSYRIAGLSFGSHTWERLSFADRPGGAQHPSLLGNLMNQELLGKKGPWLAHCHSAFLLRSVTGAQGSNMKSLSCLSLDSLIRSRSSTASEGLVCIWPVGGSFAQAVETFISLVLVPGFEWNFCLLCWRWSAPGQCAFPPWQGSQPFVEDDVEASLLRQTKEDRWSRTTYSGDHSPCLKMLHRPRPSQPFYHQLG